MKVVVVSVIEIDDIIDAGHVGDQPAEYRIAFDNDARLFFCDERCVQIGRSVSPRPCSPQSRTVLPARSSSLHITLLKSARSR